MCAEILHFSLFLLCCCLFFSFSLLFAQTSGPNDIMIKVSHNTNVYYVTDVTSKIKRILNSAVFWLFHAEPTNERNFHGNVTISRTLYTLKIWDMLDKPPTELGRKIFILSSIPHFLSASHHSVCLKILLVFFLILLGHCMPISFSFTFEFI